MGIRMGRDMVKTKSIAQDSDRGLSESPLPMPTAEPVQ